MKAISESVMGYIRFLHFLFLLFDAQHALDLLQVSNQHVTTVSLHCSLFVAVLRYTVYRILPGKLNDSQLNTTALQGCPNAGWSEVTSHQKKKEQIISSPVPPVFNIEVSVIHP